MSMIFLFFADDCRIGKKRKSEENDEMLTAEQKRKLAKTQVSADKVTCVKTLLVCTYYLQSDLLLDSKR